MVVSVMENREIAAVVAPPAPHQQQHQQQEDLTAVPIADADHELHGPAPMALQYNDFAAGGLDLMPSRVGGGGGGDRAVLVPPTRRGLDSSPALFLWESRTTNVDVMSVSNTTRPVVVPTR